jgi:hypothetical protein
VNANFNFFFLFRTKNLYKLSVQETGTGTGFRFNVANLRSPRSGEGVEIKLRPACQVRPVQGPTGSWVGRVEAKERKCKGSTKGSLLVTITEVSQARQSSKPSETSAVYCQSKEIIN